jgi:hypothetical protein
MGITFLVVAGATIALSAAYVVATRTAAQPALAGENTVVGLHDAAAETLVGGGAAKSGRNTDWQLATVNALSDAENLLDCLEARGFADRELVVLGNSCFAVRWR